MTAFDATQQVIMSDFAPARRARMLESSMPCRRMIVVACLIAFAGCQATAPRIENPWTALPRETLAARAGLDSATTRPASARVIAIDPQGRPIDPDNPGRFDNDFDAAAFARQLDAMMTDMSGWTDAHRKDGKRQVLIFVHGGLNEPLENLNLRGKLVEHRRLLIAEGYYLILIVWHPGLKSSYAEHLTKVRQGIYQHGEEFAAPFLLLADLGRAIARVPIIGTRMLAHDFSRLSGEWKAAGQNETEAAVLSGNPQLRSAFWVTSELVATASTQPGALHVSFGGIDRKPTSRGAVVLQGVEALGRGVLTFLLDAAGTAAWDNMDRRSLMLFDGPDANLLGNASRGQAKELAKVGAPGPLQQLIDALATRAPRRDPRSTDPASEWKVTVVGHSMGAIVLNEFVSHASELAIDNTVCVRIEQNVHVVRPARAREQRPAAAFTDRRNERLNRSQSFVVEHDRRETPHPRFALPAMPVVIDRRFPVSVVRAIDCGTRIPVKARPVRSPRQMVGQRARVHRSIRIRAGACRPGIGPARPGS